MECTGSTSAELDCWWYAAVGVLGFIFYEPLPQPSEVRRCPCWLHVRMLQWAKQCRAALRLAQVVLAILLATSPARASNIGWRASFAVVTFFLDMDTYSERQCHHAFILLHMSFAMILPEGAGRRGVLLVIVVHELMTSGIMKLRIGGIKWLHAETMHLILQGACEQPYPGSIWWHWAGQQLQLHWVVRLMAERLWVGFIVGLGTLVFEIALAPSVLLVTPMHHCVLFIAVIFHFAIVVVFAFNFSLHIPCYVLALWPQSSCTFLNMPTLFAMALLAFSALTAIEQWPLNTNGLFCFNSEQIRFLQGYLEDQNRFVLAHDGEGPMVWSKEGVSGVGGTRCNLVDARCLMSIIPSKLPVPSGSPPLEFLHAVGGQPFGGIHFSDAEIASRLQEWVGKSRVFVNGRTFEVFTRVEHLRKSGKMWELARST